MTRGTAEGQVTRVVIHSNGARVTRTLELPQGGSEDPERVALSGLSPFLRPSSLQVQVEGSRSVLAVESHLVSERPELDSDQARRERDTLTLRRLQHQRGQITQLRHWVARTMPLAAPAAFGGGAPGAVVEKGLALGAFLDGLQAFLDERLAETNLEIERVELRQQALYSTNPSGERRSREVWVELGPGRATRLRVSYQVSVARWWPAYTLTTSGASARAQLRMEALVAQASQEDWSGVELVLCTGELQTELQPPELSPLRLGSRATRTRRGYRAPPPGLEALFASYDRATADPDTESRPRPAERDWSASDVYIKAKVMDAPRPLVRSPAPEPPALSASQARSEGDAAELGEEPRGAGGLSPTARWLDYPRLVLGSVSDPETRGRLVPRHEASPETEERELEAALDRLETARSSRGRAGSVETRFVVQGLVSLPSDPARTERVRIDELEMRSSLRLSCVPKAEPRVHRVLEFPNSTGRSLLAGRVELLLEGSFLSTTELESVAPDRLVRLSTGVEDRLSVSRSVEVVDAPSTSALGQMTHLTQRVAIRLSSRLSEPATVELIDRLPTSDDKNVTVELIDSDAPAERYRGDDADAPPRGALRWTVVVPAGGSTIIHFTYRISLPSKQAAAGVRVHE